MKKTTRLTTRDFITIGIYSAVFFFLKVLVLSTISWIPIIFLFAIGIFAILQGPVYILLIAKVGKKGTIFTLSAIEGIIWLIMGVPHYAIFPFIFGFLAELILSLSGYNKKRNIRLSFIVLEFGYWLASFAPIIFFTDYWYDVSIKNSMESGMLEEIIRLIKGPLVILSVISAIAGAILGIQFGFKLFQKHFKRAGIA